MTADRMNRPDADERPVKAHRLTMLALTWAGIALAEHPEMSEAAARVAFQGWWLDNRPEIADANLMRRLRIAVEDAWMSVFRQP